MAATAAVDTEARPAGAGPEPADARRPVHRWRDLGRRERVWAVAVGLALLAAPVLAAAHYWRDWAPNGDPALMGLRVLDVGTNRTPLLGQPSASGQYAESVSQVHHPGAIHFYLMALPVRLLGGAAGMLLTSVAITGTSLVVSAWATFRQLGRRAGLLAALVLALIAFTTGFGPLVNPVSSNIAGYPLLASAVLLWCVACGDTRLLPAATAAVSFTALQHLSVVPATLVITLGALVLAALTWRRDGRPELWRWVRWSGVVALLMWAPALAQQAVGDAGNLGRMVWFARHGNEDTLGYGTAAGQVAHVLGLPPLLGRTALDGQWLTGPPSAVTWLTAAAVAAAVAVICWRWRSAQPRRARLGAMAGVVALAGLYNGASVPHGIEQYRLAFYHSIWPLAFFVAMVVGLAASDALAGAVAARPARRLLAVLAVVAVALPAVANTRLDRPANEDGAAYLYLPRPALDRLADGVAAHAGALGDHPVLLSRNEPLYVGYRAAVAFALAERGIDVREPLGSRFFVHDSRLVHRDRLDGGLVLVVDDEMPSRRPPGELVAEVDLPGDFPTDSYRALVAEARSTDAVVLGPDAQAAIDAVGDEGTRATVAGLLDALVDDPTEALLAPAILDFVIDHPLATPAFDPHDLRAVRAGLDGWHRGTPTGLRLFLLDEQEIRAVATPGEIGRG